jgi:hypothetical protein
MWPPAQQILDMMLTKARRNFVPVLGNGCMQYDGSVLGSRSSEECKKAIMPLEVCRLICFFGGFVALLTLSNHLLLWAL